MEDTFTNRILELYNKKDWREIVECYHDHPERSRLLWVYPSEDNLTFIKITLDELKCRDVISIGCGSGLLEWIIFEATGIPVRGIEIDGVWWKSKYAPPSFIPLLLTSHTLDRDTINLLRNNRDATALLFCYFNSREAFEEYLKYFSGSVIIIIGPDKGTGVHTNPLPFDDVSDEWCLYKWQRVRDSIDFIAIYRRSDSNKNMQL